MSESLVGLGELLKVLRMQCDSLRYAVAMGMYAGAQDIMLEARNQTPVEEGWMRASGHVAKPHMTGDGSVDVSMGFGGASEEYVVRQHEDMSLRHPNGGKAKFFSDAVDAKTKDYENTVAKYITYALKRMPIKMPAKRVPETMDEEMGPIKTSRHGRHG